MFNYTRFESLLRGSLFFTGERVLCFHGPLIYEAKCLKVQVKEKEKTVKYFVHYAGWNKKLVIFFSLLIIIYLIHIVTYLICLFLAWFQHECYTPLHMCFLQ